MTKPESVPHESLEEPVQEIKFGWMKKKSAKHEVLVWEPRSLILWPHRRITFYPDFVCTTKNSLVQNDGSKTGAASGLI
jgi:hypothetical protein